MVKKERESLLQKNKKLSEKQRRASADYWRRGCQRNKESLINNKSLRKRETET